MSYQSTWDHKRDAILAVANRVKDANAGAWAEVKVPGQKSRRFISLVAAECQRTVSPDIGCNLKRGGPDVSLDVLAMPNASGARDATGTFPGLELRDIVLSAEGPDASIGWGDATPATITANMPGGWIKSASGSEPPSVTLPSYEQLGGDAFYRARIGVPLQADYLLAGQQLNDGSAVWFSRTTYSLIAAFLKANGQPIDAAAIVNVHRAEWRAILGLPQLP